MNTYTAFCQQANGEGTTWIGRIFALTPKDAADVALADCADDWGYDVEDVCLLGIAEGDVKILHWN